LDAEHRTPDGASTRAGDHADVVIETSWVGLGTIVATGASAPLAGEPRELAGHARHRYVYAPLDGIFRTKRRIGDSVRQGQAVAVIGSMALAAPLDGALRGLTRDAVPVTLGTNLSRSIPAAQLRKCEASASGREESRKVCSQPYANVEDWP
jgi:hypothetical protein